MSSIALLSPSLRLLAGALLLASVLLPQVRAGNSIGGLIGNAGKPRPAPAQGPAQPRAASPAAPVSSAADAEARNLECLAALAVVGVDMQTRGDPAVEGVRRDVSLWKGRTQRISMAEAGEYGTRMSERMSFKQIRDIAEQCRLEVNAMTAGDCARYANAIGEELEWRLKWAGNQALIGASTNGSLQWAQDHIRQGCTMSANGLRRMQEVGCDARLVEQVQSWRAVFRLDLQSGNYLACDRD